MRTLRIAGNVSVFRHVLERNPEIDFSSSVSCSISSLGSMLERSIAKPIWDVLLNHGRREIALWAALKTDDLAAFREVLRANPELRPDRQILGNAGGARIAFWEALLDHDPRLVHTSFGHTNIGWIVYNGNVPLLSMMANRGVDITTASFMGVPPLYVAKFMANHQMVDLLVKNGAEIDEED